MILFKKLFAQANTIFDTKKRRRLEYGSYVIDYNDSIWFLGCSHVLGTGLDYTETAPFQLSKILNKKVINLGEPGSGPMMVEYQLKKLLKKYRPSSVVIGWPNFDRWQSTEKNFPVPLLWIPGCLENKKFFNDHFGSKDLWPERWKEYKNLLLENKVADINRQSYLSVKNMLKGMKTVEFQYVPDPNIDLDRPCYPFVDYARDNLHPGKQTQKIVADWVGKKLNEI